MEHCALGDGVALADTELVEVVEGVVDADEVGTGEHEAQTASEVGLHANATALHGQLVHVVQAVEPALASYFPAPHAVHAPEVDAPTTVPYRPTAHAAHALAPAAGAYRPALHAVHPVVPVATAL